MIENLTCSVIVPVYNKKKYIYKTIKSILDQDFDGNCEIIVVDDGSTDGCTDNIEKISSRIRLIRQSNSGAAAARYAGVVAAKTEIIVFHDADDLADQGKVRVLVDGLLSHRECVACFSVVKTEKSSEKTTSEIINLANNRSEYVISDPLNLMLKNMGPLALAMNLATWRSHALAVGGGREFYKAANDYDFQLRLATRGPFLFLNKITNYYTSDNVGITSKYGAWKQAAYATFAAHDLYSSLKDKEKYRESFEGGVKDKAPGAIVALFFNGQYTMSAKLFIRVFSIVSVGGIIKHAWWFYDRRQVCLIKKSIIHGLLIKVRDLLKHKG